MALRKKKQVHVKNTQAGFLIKHMKMFVQVSKGLEKWLTFWRGLENTVLMDKSDVSRFVLNAIFVFLFFKNVDRCCPNNT